MKLESEYWNQRYLEGETGWDVGQVSDPLKHYIDQLADKDLQILIPGAGNGYEAEYLVRQGFQNVFVCDYAPEALKGLQKRLPEISKDRLLLSDFFRLEFYNHFDLVLEQTFFCAIDPALRRKYFEKMHSLLKPGGKLAGLFFNDALNSDRPPFGGSAEEYQGYFNDLFKIKVFANCYNSIKPRQDRELFFILQKEAVNT